MIPLEGWPTPFKPLREPIRGLVGKWEAAYASRPEKSTLTWMNFCNFVESFFYDHPKVSRPEQVLMCDVEDWREARIAAGDAHNSVRSALAALKAFFGWAIREELVQMDNPVHGLPFVKSRRPTGTPGSGVTTLHPALIPD
jgi:hypothetical protein